jgi:hypothetical protein
MNQLKINFGAEEVLFDGHQRVINLDPEMELGTIKAIWEWFNEMQTSRCNQAEMYDYLRGQPGLDLEWAKEGIKYDTLFIIGNSAKSRDDYKLELVLAPKV